VNDFFGTLKQKMGPLPVWVWAALGTVALALYLMQKKSKSNSDQTNAAADQANSDLGSASELANMFEVAGLMPYQGGNVYVNTTTGSPTHTPGTPTPAPKVGKDIQTSHFYKTTRVTNWDALAKQLGVFGGSGQALLEYNLLPNKHTARTIADFKKTPKTIKAGEQIAVPLSGVFINLPGVGTIKS
jgi:hypothetical protein